MPSQRAPQIPRVATRIAILALAACAIGGVMLASADTGPDGTVRACIGPNDEVLVHDDPLCGGGETPLVLSGPVLTAAESSEVATSLDSFGQGVGSLQAELKALADQVKGLQGQVDALKKTLKALTGLKGPGVKKLEQQLNAKIAAAMQSITNVLLKMQELVLKIAENERRAEKSSRAFYTAVKPLP
jgi:hypothetical protein